MKLALHTVLGAAKLAAGSSETPEILRKNVTSKGGTTERAIATLDAHRVKAGIIEAVKDAAARARELGEEFGKDD